MTIRMPATHTNASIRLQSGNAPATRCLGGIDRLLWEITQRLPVILKDGICDMGKSPPTQRIAEKPAKCEQKIARRLRWLARRNTAVICRSILAAAW